MFLDAFKSKSMTTTDTEHYSRTLRDRIDSLTTMPSSEKSLRPVRQKFPADQLRPYVRQLLAKTLAGAQWDSNDRARMGAYSKEICEAEWQLTVHQRVKHKMLELDPKGYKYIVTSQFSENFGQAGRADMSCHWEDTDCAVQEMYSNDTMIFVCIAYAVRVA
ncbi:uncharacterized protein EHS24_008032 [Apiotrichum porosum]|uniref:Uncharacterized protein n=1 Tax=Apiotrichum porosum TaxID=105984 RepID=A0A427XSP1_9TREE|nr:uncharacterized protein EHS24_008032 [Apiotrichum porosum]RSH81837.1 hypothetical protein EHS24_008032 [Apiotrichum porosum]